MVAVRNNNGNTVRAVVLAVFAAGIAWTSGLNAVANSSYRRNPQAALRAEPDHALAIVTNQDRILATDPQAGVRAPARFRASALHSLRLQAINPVALRILAISYNDQPARSRGAFLLGAQMSKRDLLTQLWLIEDAVSRNQVADALSHHDAALRISEDVKPMIFPVLTSALEDPALWGAFVPYIRTPAPWLAEMWRYAIRHTRDPVAYAHLAERAGGLPRTEVFAWLNWEMLRRVADQDAYVDAFRLYRTLPGADASVPGAAAFTDASTRKRLEPVTWEVYEAPGVSSSFVPGDGSALMLSSRLDPAMTSAIARKLVMVQPGAYRFQATQWIETPSEGARGTWEVHCRGVSGRMLWSQSGDLTTQRQRIAGQFDVPADCPVVTIRITAVSGESSRGADIGFSDVSLQRVAASAQARFTGSRQDRD